MVQEGSGHHEFHYAVSIARIKLTMGGTSGRPLWRRRRRPRLLFLAAEDVVVGHEQAPMDMGIGRRARASRAESKLVGPVLTGWLGDQTIAMMRKGWCKT